MPELEKLLLDVSRAIVDCPDEVRVDVDVDGDNVVFTLHVAPSDMGKIIGKHGKNAKSIRTLMKAAGSLYNVRTDVEIAEDED
ncbi:MAG: KH domain-containing protein [Clostridia bacterium]|nr:KH domain-containing protein [Clostridia bacterium]MBR5767395.1 KH domain-containing protein [Clostridia bacterium]